jgi:hypothetical protein
MQSRLKFPWIFSWELLVIPVDLRLHMEIWLILAAYGMSKMGWISGAFVQFRGTTCDFLFWRL